ncbi:MAG TPA: ArsR family transcriptional regulator [Thermoanaerobaculia bacterium]|nr:ArsR family transcriptional regulator [Thermoanaerobaculia bacterium]
MAVSSPFGSQTRTRLLLSLELLGQSYARELARLLGASLSVVQKGLGSLERDGLIAGRIVGRTRLVQVNPQYFAATQLRALIARLLAADRDLKARAASLRRRPRRSGKRL